MIKKIMALFLVVLMSIDSMAALVSDNDGSAFITKGEFEAIKEDFNSQILNYNNSIDKRIDGAIASYLAARVGSNDSVSLLFEFNESDIIKPYSVENGYNTIKEQSFQGGYFVNSLWTTNGYRFYQFKPMLITESGSTTEGKFKNFDLVNHVCKPWYSQMKSFVFDDTNNEIIRKKLDYDVLNIHMVMTSTANQNLGRGAGRGTVFCAGIQPGYITGKKINMPYIDSSGLGADNGNTANWICSLSYSEYDNNPTWTNAKVKQYWAPTIPFSDEYANSSFFNWKRNDWEWWHETVPACSYYFTNTTKDEDKRIYIYNKCNDVIYAHALSEDTMEEYIDYMDAINALPTVEKEERIIGSDRTNLYMGGRTTPWVYWSPWRENTSTNVWHVAPSEMDFDTRINDRQQWRFIPKFKLKNTSTIVPPNTKSVSGGTNYWNTLNQFRNSLLKFTDYNNNEIYPHYYGGLPLISLGTQVYDELSFDIKIVNTTTTGTIPTNACIQIKIDEFPNENNTSSFSANDKEKLITIEGTSGGTKYSYDKTNNYLKIPLNKTVSIKMEEPKVNSTYYLRWWEDGNVNIAGGQIIELNNAILKTG